MWTGPPPALNQTVSGTDNIQTAVMRVRNGSKNVHLRWTYTLLKGQSIQFTTFSIYDVNNKADTFGHAVSGSAETYDKNGYKARFSISSTKEVATVTIKSVTERENTTFQCKIFAGQAWAYNIRLEVTGINWFICCNLPFCFCFFCGGARVSLTTEIKFRCILK